MFPAEGTAVVVGASVGGVLFLIMVAIGVVFLMKKGMSLKVSSICTRSCAWP